MDVQESACQIVANEIRSRETLTADDGLVLTLLDLIAERNHYRDDALSDHAIERARLTLCQMVPDMGAHPQEAWGIAQAVLRSAWGSP